MIIKRIAFPDRLHRLELRNVETVDVFSEESIAFHAELYFDGMHIGTVRNDGRGGEPYGRILERDAVEAYIAEALPDGITAEWWNGDRTELHMALGYASPSPELLAQLVFEGVIS